MWSITACFASRSRLGRISGSRSSRAASKRHFQRLAERIPDEEGIFVFGHNEWNAKVLYLRCIYPAIQFSLYAYQASVRRRSFLIPEPRMTRRGRNFSALIGVKSPSNRESTCSQLLM